MLKHSCVACAKPCRKAGRLEGRARARGGGRTVTHVEHALHLAAKVSVTGRVNDVNLDALRARQPSIAQRACRTSRAALSLQRGVPRASVGPSCKRRIRAPRITLPYSLTAMWCARCIRLLYAFMQ